MRQRPTPRLTRKDSVIMMAMSGVRNAAVRVHFQRPAFLPRRLSAQWNADVERNVAKFCREQHPKKPRKESHTWRVAASLPPAFLLTLRSMPTRFSRWECCSMEFEYFWPENLHRFWHCFFCKTFLNFRLRPLIPCSVPWMTKQLTQNSSTSHQQPVPWLEERVSADQASCERCQPRRLWRATCLPCFLRPLQWNQFLVSWTGFPLVLENRAE